MDQPIKEHTNSLTFFPTESPVVEAKDVTKYRKNLISNVLSLDPTLGYNYRSDLTEESEGNLFWNKARVSKATNPELVVLTTHIENAMDILKAGGQL